MKDKNYEFVKRIKSHYVGDDCIQVMITYPSNSAITILNKDGMLYHYKPNSTLFINKYISDKRKDNFPYSKIPNHKNMVGFKKYVYVNQLLDFNFVYIEIQNGFIIENYAVKDGEEALLVTKYILPNEETTKYMTRDEVLELIKNANGGIFVKDASYYNSYHLPSEERVLEWYKEQMMSRIKSKHHYDEREFEDDLTEYLYKSVDRLTINDVPSDITIMKDLLFVTIDNNEIKSIKEVSVKFMKENNYKVKCYDFPITIYSLGHVKKIEQISSVDAKEPRIPRFLNKMINKEEIKKAKRLVLERKK